MTPELVDKYFEELADNPIVETIHIPLVSRLNDNGDGGYTMYLFNSDEELLKQFSEHRDVELTPQLIEDVLTGEDEYENGYIGEETITLHRRKDGKWYIEPGTSFHAGQ